MLYLISINGVDPDQMFGGFWFVAVVLGDARDTWVKVSIDAFLVQNVQDFITSCLKQWQLHTLATERKPFIDEAKNQLIKLRLINWLQIFCQVMQDKTEIYWKSNGFKWSFDRFTT